MSDPAEEEIEAAFLKAVSKLRVDWSKVDGSWEAMMNQLTPSTWTEAFAGALIPTLKSQLHKAAADSWKEEGLKNIPIDEGITQYIDTQVAQRIVEVSDATRMGVKVVVDDMYRRGMAPIVAQRQITPIVGLHQRYSQAVAARGEKLLKTKGWTPGRVDKEQARYAKELAKKRGMLIARTELADVKAEAKIQTWRKAIVEGELSPGVQKQWIAAPGERTCPTCGSGLNGQTVPLEGFFVADGRSYFRPPAHPGCRCPVLLKRQP